MKNMKCRLLSSLVAIALFWVGVWLSGWVPERGDLAVMVYIQTILFSFAGYNAPSLWEES